MLHAKFQDPRPLDSGEEFTIYGHGGHLGHVTWIIYIHIGSPFLKMLHINLALIGQVVSEKIFEIVDGRTDGRRTDGRRIMAIL